MPKIVLKFIQSCRDVERYVSGWKQPRLKNIRWQYGVTIFGIAIIIVVGIIYIFNKPEPVAAWYNDGWAYRQTITISNSGAAQTNTQVKILSAANLSSLVTAGKLQSDLDDLRFTDINGNVLKYWIEDSTNSSVDVWAFVDYVPAEDATIYMYYGNPSATTASDTSLMPNGGTITGYGDSIVYTFLADGNFVVYNSLTVDVLLVAGGGSGGGRHGGGGGGGGVIYITDAILSPGNYPAVIGDGGNAVGGTSVVGNDGGNTTFIGETANGGGGGGTYSAINGRAGGSAGGGGYNSSSPGIANQGNPSFYTGIGYGNNGGASNHHADGGGGGGAGSVGGATDGTYGGDGGAGIQINIDGNNYYWAGGGGGAIWDDGAPVAGGNGGIGGGGAGGYGENSGNAAAGASIASGGGSAINSGGDTQVGSWNSWGGAGGANTGGGGGGSGQASWNSYPAIGGAAGGSGIVIVRYTSPADFSIGTPSSEEKGPGPIAYWKFDEGYGAVTKDTNWQKAGDTTNLINNPRFENSSGVTAGGTTPPTVTYESSSDSYIGTKRVKIVFPAGATTGYTGSRAILQTVGMTPGVEARYSIYYKSSSSEVNKLNNYITGSCGDATYSYFTTTTDWTRMTLVYDIGAGLPSCTSEYFTIYVGTSPTSPITLYIDAHQVEIGPAATPYCDGALTNNGAHTWAGTTNNSNSTCEYGTDGIITGATWQTEDMCVVGKCLNFDGTDDYVEVKHSTSFTTGLQGGFTMSAWIKPVTAGPGGGGRIFDKTSDANCTAGFCLRLDGSNQRLASRINADNTIYSANNSIVHGSGVWYYVAVTINSGGLVTYYINGTQSGTPASANALSGITTTNDLRIGNRSANTDYTFDGFIDEPRIYNYVRTAAQVKADYLAGQSGSPSGVGASFGGGQQQGDSEGLVGYWDMDEASGNILDSSGNGNTGLPTGTSVVVGKYGKGRSFNGSTDFVDVSNPSVLNFGQNSFSLSVWFNRTGDSPGDAYGGNLVGKGSWSTEPGYALYVSDGDDSVGFQIRRADGEYYATSGSTIVNGQWYLATAVRDAENKKGYLYLNGVLIGSYDEDVIYDTTNSHDVYIGALDIGGKDREFYGSIDDVKLYNVARTAEQIMRDYKKGPGPVTYYNFEEGSGTTLFDRSGNSHNSSSFIGSPTWSIGKLGGALNFNGTSDSISLPSAALPATSKVTICTWAKGEDEPRTNSLFEADDASGNRVLNSHINYSNGLTYWDFGDATYARISKANNTSFYNVWNHWCYVSDDEEDIMKIYVNGLLWHSGSPAKTLSTAPSEFYLGSGSSPVANFFKGSIDEFKIYNYARSQEQILWDMHGDESPHPIAYWDFNEGYGTTPQDSSGNNEDINSWVNSPVWTTNGKFGNAIDLSANGAQVKDNTFNYNILKPGYEDGSWTLSIWAQPGSAPDFGEKIIFGRQGHHAGILANTTTFEFQIRNNVPSEVVSITKTITNWNQWYYLTATYDDHIAKFYVNGDLVGTDTMTGTHYSHSDVIWMGFNDPYDFNGIVDEAKIFNFALSQEQIRQEYTRGSQVSLGQQKSSSETWDAGGFGGNAPIAYWNFEEGSGSTIQDVSSGSHTGTIINAVYGLGKPGWGLSLDGTDDHVSVTRFTIPSSNLTLSSWIKTTSTDSGKDYLGNAAQTIIGDDTNGVGVGFGVTGGKVQYNYYSNTSWTAVTGNISVSDGEWHHITATHASNGTINLYVDGLFDNTGSKTTAGDRGVDTIGAGYDSGDDAGDEFTGLIDEVKIFNYARTPAQIAYDYNGGKPVGWWRFNDGEGIIARDNSGNGNNGTLTSMDPATDWVDGKYEGALDFGGNGDYVGSTSYTYTFGDEMTLSAWFKENGAGTGSPRILEISDLGNADSHALAPDGDGTVRAWAECDTGTRVAEVSDSTVYSSDWHHFVYTYDNPTGTIYIDGKSTATATGACTNLDDGAYLIMGAVSDGSGTYSTSDHEFDGQIDDVRIYNYALTADQVKEVMNYGSVYIK